MATARTNAESLLVHIDAVEASLKIHAQKNQRAESLLKLLDKRGEILLELSLVCLLWSAFCGPVLRTAEERMSTISQVKNEMKACASETEKIILAADPYDTLFSIAKEKSQNKNYYRYEKKATFL